MKKTFDKESKIIEDIEEYYLSVITRYLGADYKGLIQYLENHNKSWNTWYPKLKGSKGSKNFFDAGAERVVYMLLNRGDIFGDPSANPLGSDNSFLKYDSHFKQHLAINIDVKCTKANTNFDDFLGNSPIGKNQNSYTSFIKLRHKLSHQKEKTEELRKYVPNLDTNFQVVNDNGETIDYLNITYSIIIFYCELKEKNIPNNQEEPTEQRVISVITTCIPNGKLYKIYNDEVFSPGKTSDLRIKEGEKIDIGNGETWIANGTEKVWGNEKDGGRKVGHPNKNITFQNYLSLNANKGVEWYPFDARFNYKDIKFETLKEERKSRVKKIYLDLDLFNKFIKERNFQKFNLEKIEFLKNLKPF